MHTYNDIYPAHDVWENYRSCSFLALCIRRKHSICSRSLIKSPILTSSNDLIVYDEADTCSNGRKSVCRWLLSFFKCHGMLLLLLRQFLLCFLQKETLFLYAFIIKWCTSEHIIVPSRGVVYYYRAGVVWYG